MTTEIVLFTRDLRVRDNPALAAAARRAEHVLPLFVHDDRLLSAFGAPRRRAFLEQSLHDLARSLGGLAVRRGDTVAETIRLASEVGARVVHVAEDASAFAKKREARLREALHVETHPASTVVPLASLRTTVGDAYRVFGPFRRAWLSVPRRPPARAPKTVLPSSLELCVPGADWAGDPDWPGGETEGRRRLARFLDAGLDGYRGGDDDLAREETSRLGPYLHFGCISPLELERRAAGNEAFVRQLCWRDFYLHLLAAHPRLPRDDLQRHVTDWRDDDEAFDAWRSGATGYPLVDAAMRQLEREGWMHNRARLVVASFLSKTLRIDWRRGARHFAAHLIDGDLAANSGNWQWVAGTGTNPRPNLRFNPVRQALRHDPSGEYVRRYVPELAGVRGRAVHAPWTVRQRLDYPPPIVEPAQLHAR